MKTYYSISIPEPCHENWNQMTPKDKGRFCDSCSKTVIDFTKMNTYEIQGFLSQNQENRVCGHFKQTQLESVHLLVPIQTLVSKSVHKLFLLALLITMGTSLLSCTKTNGSKQKINSVEIIDSISNKVISLDTLETVCDSTSKVKYSAKTKGNIPPPKPVLTGLVIVSEPHKKKDSIEETIITTTGDVVITNTAQELDSILGFIHVDTPPQFKNTPHNLTTDEKRKYFRKQINDIVTENFDIKIASELSLKGKQRIYAMFTINKNGKIEDIKTRAPHIKLEEEAKRIIKLFPKFSPGKQNDKAISVTYNLPIIFEVED